MKAARLYGPYDLRIEDIPTPKIEDGWVLIRSIAVGICGTDKAFYTGRYPLFKRPLIPGHEAVGTVVEGPKDVVGNLVVPEINFSCLRCTVCREGLYTHCPYKKTLGIDFDGSMAEFFVAPIHALHIVYELDPVVATEVEPLAALLNGLEMNPPNPLQQIAVIGSGNLAILLIQLLLHMGIRPVVVVRGDSPKRVYLTKFDIDVVELENVDEYVRKHTRDGLGFDLIFEVSGDPQALDVAIRIARPRATIHLKSTPGAPGCINTTFAVVKELKIVTSRCGTYRHFEKAIDLLREGIVKPIITSVIQGLDNAKNAFDRALRREEVKVVLRIG